MKHSLKITALGAAAAFFMACNGCKSDPAAANGSKTLVTAPPKPAVAATVPVFSPDSAFSWIEKQLAFGPRVPNSEAHSKCKDFLVSEFKRLGLTVKEQPFSAKKFDGLDMAGTNILAQYKPELTYRVLISAHWDSRFASDHDPNGIKDKGVPAADDGGSGAAVILELARILKAKNLEMGIDFCLWDLEDQGDDSGQNADSWCLGSAYWAKNKHIAGALWGINLDMVGAKGARFGRERLSYQTAPELVDKVWALAAQMGYGKFFVPDFEGPITDDHAFVTQGGVPCIDIINRQLGTTSGFGAHWHTQNDNISVIDKATLQAVGQTVAAAIVRQHNQTL